MKAPREESWGELIVVAVVALASGFLFGLALASAHGGGA